MTIPDIECLEALAEKATPGPWKYIDFELDDKSSSVVYSSDTCKPPIATTWASESYGWDADLNAQFIAACDPQHILALCALARRGLAEKENAK